MSQFVNESCVGESMEIILSACRKRAAKAEKTSKCMENVLDIHPASPRLELFLLLTCPWKQISHFNPAWDYRLLLESSILKEQKWESLEFCNHTPRHLPSQPSAQTKIPPTNPVCFGKKFLKSFKNLIQLLWNSFPIFPMCYQGCGMSHQHPERWEG